MSVRAKADEEFPPDDPENFDANHAAAEARLAREAAEMRALMGPPISDPKIRAAADEYEKTGIKPPRPKF